MSDNTVEIGTLRKSGTGLEKLFEAVRVASALGHKLTVVLTESPIPAPAEPERDWDKTRREDDSAIIEFLADLGDA